MTTFTGTSGNDFLPGSGKNNSGNDIFIGGAGNDDIDCGTGDEVSQVSPGDGFDAVKGGAGNDSVVAMANNMYIGFSQFGGTYSVETVSVNNH